MRGRRERERRAVLRGTERSSMENTQKRRREQTKEDVRKKMERQTSGCGREQAK